MKRNDDEEQRLVRRYLLGDLSGDEQERLEVHLISDSGYKEKVLIIEDELIEDYLSNALSNEEKEKFVRHFLSTPQQLQKLKIAKALTQYFSVEAAADSPTPLLDDDNANTTAPRVGVKHWFPSFLRFRHPLVAVSLAAALLLIIVSGSWVLIDRWRRSDQTVQEQDRNREFQSELVRLNAAASNQGQSEAEALALTLPPLTFRGGGELPVITLPIHADIVQLQLVLPTDDRKNYRVSLQKSGDAQRFVVSDLAARNTEGGKAVLLIVPARHLSRGDYLLELSAPNAEGQFESVGGYSFRVRD